jgi:hypothetical protein
MGRPFLPPPINVNVNGGMPLPLSMPMPMPMPFAGAPPLHPHAHHSPHHSPAGVPVPVPGPAHFPGFGPSALNSGSGTPPPMQSMGPMPMAPSPLAALNQHSTPLAPNGSGVPGGPSGGGTGRGSLSGPSGGVSGCGNGAGDSLIPQALGPQLFSGLGLSLGAIGQKGGASPLAIGAGPKGSAAPPLFPSLPMSVVDNSDPVVETEPVIQPNGSAAAGGVGGLKARDSSAGDLKKLANTRKDSNSANLTPTAGGSGVGGSGSSGSGGGGKKAVVKGGGANSPPTNPHVSSAAMPLLGMGAPMPVASDGKANAKGGGADDASTPKSSASSSTSTATSKSGASVGPGTLPSGLAPRTIPELMSILFPADRAQKYAQLLTQNEVDMDTLRYIRSLLASHALQQLCPPLVMANELYCYAVVLCCCALLLCSAVVLLLCVSLMHESHLKEMGVPMGPMLRIMEWVKVHLSAPPAGSAAHAKLNAKAKARSSAAAAATPPAPPGQLQRGASE